MARSNRRRAGPSRWLRARAKAAALCSRAPLVLAAPQPFGPFALAFPARIHRLLQIFRVGRIHSEKRLLDVFHQANVDLVRNDVALVDQSAERIEKLAFLHFLDAVDQQFPEERRAGKPDLFQDRDLAAIELNFATHEKTFLRFRRMSRLYAAARAVASSRSHCQSFCKRAPTSLLIAVSSAMVNLDPSGRRWANR